MPSTNKTTELQLSQFIGTDVPTWLGDYNGDMLKIDTAISQLRGGSADEQIAALQQSVQSLSENLNVVTQGLYGFNIVKHTINKADHLIGDTNFHCYGCVNQKINQIFCYGVFSSISASQASDLIDGLYYVPVATTPTNLVGSGVGNINTRTNVYNWGKVMLRVFSPTTASAFGELASIWDGTKTVLYIRARQLSYFNDTNDFNFNITSLNGGQPIG